MCKVKYLPLVLALLFGLRASAQQTTIATNLPYGETLEFTVELADGQDSVKVDWGDGKLQRYKDPEQYWLSNTWVHGKLLNDTIKMYGSIKSIEIENDSITVLQFKEQDSLAKVFASGNKLTNEGLDLSGCPNVQLLDLSDNNLMNLNLMSFNNLESFDVSNNPLFNTAVFADGSTKLETIDMANCDIVHFYPVSLPNLRTLNIENGSLTDIEIGANYPNLQSLTLSGNKDITSINLTEAPLLDKIALGYTGISELNIVNNTALTDIDINHTKVSKLNVQSCKNLASLNIKACPISKLDVRGLFALRNINADSTNISRLDLSDKRFVRNISVRSTNIEFIDLHNGIGYNTLRSIDMSDCKNMTAQTLNFTFDAMPPHEGSSYGINVMIAGSNGEHANTDVLTYD